MCVSPLKGIVYGINSSNGKKLLKVVPQSFVPSENENVIPIPCGKCIECRLQHARNWSDRMMAEASYYTDNVFLTLTYDNDSLPEPLTRFNESGELEVSPVHPLVKRDLQLFIKRLRKHFPDQRIRYYACGEYGDKSMRPHYHLILFNLRLEDAKLLYTSEDGYSYFTSESISKLWSYGLHILTDVNWQTCNYVSRYVTKKLIHGYDDMPEKLNYPQEFSVMSRKPGIGYQWYQDHKDSLSLFNESYLSDDKGSRKIGMNKYFNHLLEIDDQELYNLIKAEKVEISRNKELLSTLPYEKRNLNRQLNLEAKTTQIRQRKEL